MLLLYHERKKEKREWRKIISFRNFFPTLNNCDVQLAPLIAISVIGTRATITVPVPVTIRSIITIIIVVIIIVTVTAIV